MFKELQQVDGISWYFMVFSWYFDILNNCMLAMDQL